MSNQTKVNDGASSSKDAAAALDKVSGQCEFIMISMSLKLKRPKFVRQTEKKCKHSLSMLRQINQSGVQCLYCMIVALMIDAPTRDA